MRRKVWNEVVPVLCILCMFMGCTSSKELEKEEYLMKSGMEIVSIAKYNEAVKMTGSVYSIDEMKDPVLLKNLQMRVLKELKEGVVLTLIAKEQGVMVSDKELDLRLEEIKGDFPEGMFEEVLLENVISLKSWRDSLRERMLKEKVIRVCLEEKINVSPEELKSYYSKIESERDSEKEEQTSNEILLLRFRKEKAELQYGDWINGYLEKFPVELNVPVWERLSAG